MDTTRLDSVLPSKTMQNMINWRPKIGQRVAYVGSLLRTQDGGPVEFIVARIDPAGTAYDTLAGRIVCPEPVLHLSFPGGTKEVFAAAISNLALVA